MRFYAWVWLVPESTRKYFIIFGVNRLGLTFLMNKNDENLKWYRPCVVFVSWSTWPEKRWSCRTQAQSGVSGPDFIPGSVSRRTDPGMPAIQPCPGNIVYYIMKNICFPQNLVKGYPPPHCAGTWVLKSVKRQKALRVKKPKRKAMRRKRTPLVGEAYTLYKTILTLLESIIHI